jgi:hypothetical protein
VLFLSDFNRNIPKNFIKKFAIHNITDRRTVKVELFDTKCRRTDRHDEANTFNINKIRNNNTTSKIVTRTTTVLTKRVATITKTSKTVYKQQQEKYYQTYKYTCVILIVKPLIVSNLLILLIFSLVITVDPRTSNGLMFEQLETRTKNSRKIRF